MKILKRVVLVSVICMVASGVAGYFYFGKKFTPPENYLSVHGSEASLPISWIATEASPISALLLPIRIKNIPTIFYMQLDFGSPVTVFYSNSLTSIKKKYPSEIAFTDSLHLNGSFELGKMNVSSKLFKILDYGDSVAWTDPNTENIIGTIGTDLLEKRTLVLNLKSSVCSLIETAPDSIQGYSSFQFKKRRILLPAKIEEEHLWLLFDSGTSGFELITSQENCEKYADKNSELKTTQGNSWGNTLTVFTAKSSKRIAFGLTHLKLSEVTYIKGTSFLQNILMRLSGMQGMIGNKLFMGKTIILDCANQKFVIY